MTFTVNNQIWKVEFVNPSNSNLKRSDGSITLGMTDNNTKTVYINNRLNDYMTRKVLAHELCHCFCFSYNVYMPIEEEERLADWISLYGTELVYLLDNLLNSIIKRTS